MTTAVLRSLVAALVAAIALVVGAPAAGADQPVDFTAGDGAAHISLFGDSTLAGVRWYADYGALERYNFVLDAESCRRTIELSCISREGYRSRNVIAAMQSHSGELGDVVVIMSGYNDPIWTIDEAIEGVLAEARRQDVDHVIWLTLRIDLGVDYSDPQHQSSAATFHEYNDQLIEAAHDSDGFLQVADWASVSTHASGWFTPDGVHLTPSGVDAVTSFIAAQVGHVLAGNNVTPAAAPWTVLVPGAEGDDVVAIQEALIDEGIDVPGGADGVYGNDTMAAVAAFQRETDGLLATGAVDVATARALGVVAPDPDATTTAPTTTAEATTTVAPTTTVAAPTTTVAAVGPAVTPVDTDDSGRGSQLLVLLAAIVGVISLTALALFARRRQVVARRQRRLARVHPATAPGRSIADLRRAGELPPRRPYDHQLDPEPVD